MAVTPTFHFGAQASRAKYLIAPLASVTVTGDSQSGVGSSAWSIVGAAGSDVSDWVISSPTLHTCVVTAPSGTNKAAILQRVVTSGTNRYVSTAKLYSGIETICTNETDESDPVSGWAPLLNDALLNAGNSGLTSAQDSLLLALQESRHPALIDVDVSDQGSGAVSPNAGIGSWIVDDDGFFLSLEWTQGSLNAAGTEHIFTADSGTGNGTIYLVRTASVWTFGARAAGGVGSATVGTINGSLGDIPYAAPTPGDQVRCEAWYFPLRGLAGFRIWVNGCSSPALEIAVAGGVIAVPTRVYWGSNRAAVARADNPLRGQIQRMRAYKSAAAPANRADIVNSSNTIVESGEILIMGDSTSQGTSGGGMVGACIYTQDEALTRPGIFSIAHSGDRVEDQRLKLIQRVRRNDPQIKAGIIQIGANDFIADATSAEVFSAVQGLINEFRARLPNALLYVSRIAPCDGYASMTSPRRAQLAAYQAIFLTLENVNGGFITAPYVTLGGGTTSLLPAYSIDGIHANFDGQRVQGAGNRAALVSGGVLPDASVPSPITPMCRRGRNRTAWLDSRIEQTSNLVSKWGNEANNDLSFTATGTDRPTYLPTGGPDGEPCIRVARASSQYLTSGKPARRFLAHDAGYYAFVFKTTGPNESGGNVFQRDALFGTSGALVGCHLTDATPDTISAYGHDGVSAKTATASGVVANQWHLFQGWYRDDLIYAQLDKGTPVSAAFLGFDQSTGALNTFLQLLHGFDSATFFDGDLRAVCFANVAPDAQDLLDAVEYGRVIGVPGCQ